MESEVKSLSPIQLFATLWTVEKESWSGLPFPFPGDLPDPGIEPSGVGPPVLPCPLSGDLPNLRAELRSPALQADFLLPEPPGKPALIPTLCSSPFLSVPPESESESSSVVSQLFATPLTLKSVEFSRPDYWSG